MPWTDPTTVAAALGESAAPPVDDPWLTECCAAAAEVAHRKRAAAGYLDPPATDPPPSADVGMGTTLYAVALWRERGAADGFPSFEDLSSFTPTGGSWGQIRRLWGIGRAQVDSIPIADQAALLARRARRRRTIWRW